MVSEKGGLCMHSAVFAHEGKLLGIYCRCEFTVVGHKSGDN